MRKEILAEDFMNSSKAYTDLQGAVMEMFEDNPIMLCVIGQLCKLADDYYMAIMRIYNAGMTLDEAVHMQEGENGHGSI